MGKSLISENNISGEHKEKTHKHDKHIQKKKEMSPTLPFRTKYRCKFRSSNASDAKNSEVLNDGKKNEVKIGAAIYFPNRTCRNKMKYKTTNKQQN